MARDAHALKQFLALFHIGWSLCCAERSRHDRSRQEDSARA